MTTTTTQTASKIYFVYNVTNADQSRTLLRDGGLVTYHGSLTTLHGDAYFCGPCCCRHEDCTGYELETPNGQVIKHVRAESFSLCRVQGPLP